MIDPTGSLQGAAAAGVFPTTYSFNRDGVVGGARSASTAGGARGSGASKPTFRAPTSTVRRACCGRRSEHSQISQASPRAWTGLARCGCAAGNWLFYGTGGLAYGHVKYSYSNTNVPFGGAVIVAVSDSNIETGWTAGGGVEYGWNELVGEVGRGALSQFPEPRLDPPRRVETGSARGLRQTQARVCRSRLNFT